MSDCDGAAPCTVTETAWLGDSDDPMASSTTATLGIAPSNPSLTSPERMLPPEPSRRTDDVSHRSGCASSSSSNGRAVASPTSVTMPMCSRSTSSSTWVTSMDGSS